MFKRFSHCYWNSKGRSGAMIVLIAVVLVVVVTVLLFSVDLASMQLARTQLRATTDAAARAAGETLALTQDIPTARQAAKDLALINKVAGNGLQLQNSDIKFGKSTQQPDGTWNFANGGTPINSVRVTGMRTSQSPSGKIPLLLENWYEFEPVHTATVVRLDRDICLVVDRSSSMKLDVTETSSGMSTSDPRMCDPPNMATSRWGALSDAVDLFVNMLDATPQSEYCGLVSYGSNGTWCGVSNSATDVDQALTANATLVCTAMDTISNRVFNGGTDIAAGIQAGITVLSDPQMIRPYAVQTMIVMTDGHQIGGTSPVSAAATAAENNITVHTITFGSGANQTQMRNVANAGEGIHYHANTVAELDGVFTEIALTLPVVLTD